MNHNAYDANDMFEGKIVDYLKRYQSHSRDQNSSKFKPRPHIRLWRDPSMGECDGASEVAGTS